MPELENDGLIQHTLPKEGQEQLTMISFEHQRFIDLVADKARYNPKEAMQIVERVEMAYQNIMNKYPEEPIIAYQLATLYMQTNRNGLAIRLLKPLADGEAPVLSVFNNLGAAYRNEHMNEQARNAFERALACQRHPDVLANIGALWVNEGEPEKGIPYARECLRRQPDNKQGRWNLGLLLLENKEYDEGFRLYAEGFFTGERIVRYYKDKNGDEAKFWLGEPVGDRTIVFHGEQGVGDELLFLQFIPEFRKAHPEAKVILDVHPRLHTAIQRSFPDAENVFPTRKTIPEWNETIRVDFKDGLGSLPRWYHTARRKNVGWLKPNVQLVDFYTDIIRKIQTDNWQEGKPVIGIAWTGGKKKTRADLRAIPIHKWLPILQQDATFISLEYKPESEGEVSSLLTNHGVILHHWPDVVENFDYEHTLALSSVCDLVICVNTSMVHVRGSMDRPCWTLTPYGHAWRYGKTDERNPFYQSVLQIQQGKDESWENVIDKTAEKVSRYIKEFKR